MNTCILKHKFLTRAKAKILDITAFIVVNGEKIEICSKFQVD